MLYKTECIYVGILMLSHHFQSPVNNALPLMVLGTVSVIGGLSVLMLPETGNHHLSNTLEEVEECVGWVLRREKRNQKRSRNNNLKKKNLSFFNTTRLCITFLIHVVLAYRTLRRKNTSTRLVIMYHRVHRPKNNGVILFCSRIRDVLCC